MQITRLDIPDVLLIEPKIFCDDRGFFFESFNQRLFNKAVGQKVQFVQDNHSESIRGVLRGLHYQLPPKDQGKLVRVVKGEIFDVAVDIRKSSPTYGKWVGEILSGKNKKQLWIPQGFAHGFFVISEQAEILYKVSEYYSQEHERCIIWSDSFLKVAWPRGIEPLLSERDKHGSSLDKLELFE